MITFTTEKKKKWTTFKIILMLCMALLCIPMVSIKAQAATTCKSKMAYPGTTTAQVNMRKKAGIKYKSYGMIEKNAEVTILGYVTNKKQTWYKCKANVNGIMRTGYVSAAYIKKASDPTGVVNSKVTSYLNVRKSAKASSKCKVRIPKGTSMNVLSIKKVSSDYWYKVRVTYDNKTQTGYVLSTYVDVQSNIAVADNQAADAGANTDNNTQPAPSPVPDTEQKIAGYVNENVTTVLNVRNEANTKSAILMTIPRNTVVTILGESGDWYKITVTYGGKTVTGYVSKPYVTIGTVPTDSNSNNNQNIPTDASYEVLLNAFPESYKTYLRALHNDYPNWRFVAINTNLDWSTVIQNESVVGRNVIQSNYPKNGNSLAPFSYLSTASGAYDWSKDSYIVKDGTNWYSADPAVIAYYMDPRNFLNSIDIFQFEALAFDSSHSSTIVQSILNNTFMKGDYSVVDSATNQVVSGSYTQAFMDAGKTAQANPYFLATRSKQEVGVNGSNSTSGTYAGYEGIYNFYNIGAFDGGDAVAKALQWARTGTAYGKPWTNPYKSIVGGGQYIAETYINKGQNTRYFQKFNVAPTDVSSLYVHQYMTNVQAAYYEGRSVRSAYNTLGVLGGSMVFYIPVYNNMPASASQLPATAGNPNPFLSNIEVYNGNSRLSMTPTFSMPSSNGTLSNSTYSIAVGKNVSSVTIKASAISSKTTISGTGTVNLKAAGQTTTVNVIGKAQNGRTQVYTINIVRKSS